MQDLTPGVSVGLVGMLAELGTHDRVVVIAIGLARLLLALLGTLTLWLYDAYKPLADVRFAGSGHGRRRREA